MFFKRCICFLVAFHVLLLVSAQDTKSDLGFFEPADSLHKTRFYTALGITTANFTGFTIALTSTWYDQYERTGFHFFNDWDEWNSVDKAGHIYTTYLQSVWWYKGARWTGLNESQSILSGVIAGSVFQSTVEVLDGFSSKWGFSLSDFGSNALGTAAFVIQQKKWGQQKFIFKESSAVQSRPNILIGSVSGNSTTTLSERGNDLFGSSFAEQYLKDYNNQTYWLSANLHSLLSEGNKIPGWLNIAFGYGAENLYGGFENSWSIDDEKFILDADLYPRYRQYYLSLDIDFNRIKTDNHFLKTVFTFLNIIKVPAPALEINTTGEVIFHFLKF